VVVVRDGKEQTVKVTLGRLEDGDEVAAAPAATTNDETQKPDKPEAAPLPATDVVLGMKLATLNEETRKKYGIAEDVDGVVITEVSPNSAAAERRVEPGDVIVEVGQEAMDTPGDVADRVEELKSNGRRNALLMLSSKTGELRFVTVRVE
jgi:serine protease Do